MAITKPAIRITPGGRGHFYPVHILKLHSSNIADGPKVSLLISKLSEFYLLRSELTKNVRNEMFSAELGTLFSKSTDTFKFQYSC
jgi:hypothetical protein